MENYLVSARKYRPDTFVSVVGQKALTTTLQNAIKNRQLAHAYLFCGPRGVGKTTCARIFAKAINCMHPLADGEACNECESCRSFNEQRSLNIFELDAASNNSVDDIRQLTDQVRIPPQLGKYKVYIIDEVHMLSTAAFNAFLKTLEEPPAHAVFVLATTEKHKIIPTILSRCQIYDFHRISIRDIQEHLEYVARQEDISFEPSALNVIAMKSDGGMRDALSIFDQVASFGEGKITYKGVIENLNVLDYDYYFRLVDACLINNTTDALLLFDEVLNLGFEGKDFINGLCSHLRDLLVCKNPASVKLLEVGDDIRTQYLSQAAACSFEYLFQSLKTANECSLQYAVSKNKRLLVELCLLRLCHPQGNQSEGSGAVAPVKPQPATVTPQPAPITQQPAAVKPQPAPVTPQQASATPQQAPVTQQPAAVKPQPASATVTPQPQNAAFHPASTAQASAPKTTPGSSAAPKTFSLKQSRTHMVEEQQNAAPIEQEENAPFTDDDLHRAWKAYAETITEDPQLKTALTTDEPRLVSEDTFQFYVFHPNLENRLLGLKPEIEKFLHTQLHNTHLTMQVRVTEGDENKKALKPQDQLKEMIANNPNVAEFGRLLNLELD